LIDVPSIYIVGIERFYDIDTLFWLLFTGRCVVVVTDLKRQNTIINEVHVGVGVSFEAKSAAGHFGRDKMVALINSRWHFPLITARVTQYLKYCDTCQRANTYKTPKSGAILHPHDIPTKVWAKIGLDLIGPLTLCNGYKYICTAIDYYTKWPEAVPLKDKSGLSVGRFLWQLQCRYGASEIHITDQGTEFNNQLSKEFCRLSGIQQKVATAYHPQTNGLVERQNRTTNACIRKSLEDRFDQWVYALDSVLFSYRVQKHASTKFTPYRLMFGWDPIIPAQQADNLRYRSDGATGSQPPLPEPHIDTSQMSQEELVDHLEAAHAKIMKKAKTNNDRATACQVKYYNMRNASHAFQVGEKVQKKNSAALARVANVKWRWRGPYKIVAEDGNGGF
jgi:hypothetical protein